MRGSVFRGNYTLVWDILRRGNHLGVPVSTIEVIKPGKDQTGHDLVLIAMQISAAIDKSSATLTRTLQCLLARGTIVRTIYLEDGPYCAAEVEPGAEVLAIAVPGMILVQATGRRYE
jgi:hypothetical protein